MIVKFNNVYLQKIYEGKQPGKKPKYSEGVILRFKKTVLMLQHAESITEIKKFKGLNFEKLKGDLNGFYSVRVDLQYRLVLSIEEDKSIVVADMIVIQN